MSTLGASRTNSLRSRVNASRPQNTVSGKRIGTVNIVSGSTQLGICRILAASLVFACYFGPGAGAEESAAKIEKEWKRLPLVDGKRWIPSEFGTDGNIEINDDAVRLGRGDPLTGVTYRGDFPKSNYEVRFEAQRLSDFDFFVGFTFPIGEDYCSLILGGWAGYLSGFSTIDGYDASENMTTQEGHYDNDRWYKVRVRVTDSHVQGFVDGKKRFEVPREGHRFDIRAEVSPSRPLGMASYACATEFRNFRYRTLAKDQPNDASPPSRDKP